MKGFVIPVSELNHPSFQDFLSWTEEEFGYNHPMVASQSPAAKAPLPSHIYVYVYKSVYIKYI